MKGMKGTAARFFVALLAISVVVGMSPGVLAAAQRAQVRPACGDGEDGEQGQQVQDFRAVGSEGLITLSWAELPAGTTVRIIRSAQDFVENAEITNDEGDGDGSGDGETSEGCDAVAPSAVRPMCEDVTDAQIVYEGDASGYADTAVESGDHYYYSAFLSDGQGCWGDPVFADAYAKTEAPLPEPSLSTKHVHDRVRFSVRGAIPKHVQKTKIRLLLMRKINGHYKVVKSGTYAVKAGAKYYIAKTVVSKSGSWKVVATHADYNHLRSTSRPRFFHANR